MISLSEMIALQSGCATVRCCYEIRLGKNFIREENDQQENKSEELASGSG